MACGEEGVDKRRVLGTGGPEAKAGDEADGVDGQEFVKSFILADVSSRDR
jgi:hypothetical protein